MHSFLTIKTFFQTNVSLVMGDYSIEFIRSIFALQEFMIKFLQKSVDDRTDYRFIAALAIFLLAFYKLKYQKVCFETLSGL